MGVHAGKQCLDFAGDYGVALCTSELQLAFSCSCIKSAVMTRALLALLLAPLLASVIFGPLWSAIFSIMLIVTILVALPLFLVLKRLKRLDWWHALVAGALCGVAFAAVDIRWSYSGLDQLVSGRNIFYIALGACIGLAYWWIGIFRNPTFSFVDTSLARSAIGVIVVVLLGSAAAQLGQVLQPTFHTGRVLAVLKEPESKFEIGRVAVRLSSGSTVEADLHDAWQRPGVEGKCFHLWEHWSTFRARRTYSLNSQFGGGINDC